MWIRGALVAAVASALLLGGCSSSATLTSASNLSKVGQGAALQMEQNATLSSSTLGALRKAVAFNDGYNGQIDLPASQDFLAHMESIQARTQRYAKMLESLAATYAALGDLASYDAAGGFNAAFGGLVKDSNAFLASVKPGTQIPKDATSPVQVAGGFVIGAVQADKVVDASRAIKAALLTVIPVLEEPTTREALVLTKRLAVDQIDQAAVVLFASGVYSYAPLLDDLGAPLNLKSDKDSDAAVAKNDKLKRGLRNVAVEQANEQAAALAASYDKSVAALKALVPLHDSLEKGAPLNFDSALAIIRELQTLAASLQPAAKGK